jgi:succinate-semialdehyde dehydrogenase/glutarate-semialdehyde dehydrogenase
MNPPASPLALLKDPTLLKTDGLINGQWIAGTSRFDVHDPATGLKLADVANLGPAEAEAAIAAANAAWPAWRGKTAKERSIILRKWFDLLMANQDDLGRLMTAEQGKPLAEAKGEVAYGASFVEWFAEEAKRVNGETLPQFDNNRRLMVLRQPIGVCAAITPWNFPLAMITRKVAPALAAGCPVVIKPAELTPLTALAAAELAIRAGMPAGVLNMLTADSAQSIAIGKVLCASDVVRHISLHRLHRGGPHPDGAERADGQEAVAGAGRQRALHRVRRRRHRLRGRRRHRQQVPQRGQTCVCSNRLYVQDGVYDEFVKKFAAKVKTAKVGNGFEDGVNQGPLIEEAALEKVQRHVDDAVAKGARVLAGGKRQPERPVLRTHGGGRRHGRHAVRPGGNLRPVCAGVPFQHRAGGHSRRQRHRIRSGQLFLQPRRGPHLPRGEALEYGMVGINVGILATEHVPFGGVKQSGLGREGSHHGMDDYVEIKYLCLGDILK